MKYLALLIEDEAAWPEPGTPEFDADVAHYTEFDERAGDTVVGGAALQPTSTAVTLRGAGTGTPVVTDGPFAESAEAIGGFYVFEASNLDEVVSLVERLPAAANGAIEVRPMVEWEHRDDSGADAGGAGTSRTQYLALLAGRETEADIPGTPEWDEAVERHGAFAEKAGDAVVSGGALHPAAAATTVRVREGETVLSDGPFLESAEVIGGLYVLAAVDRDEAVRIASMIPLDDGAVEVRPIMELDA